jgi:hypothetical protein
MGIEDGPVLIAELSGDGRPISAELASDFIDGCFQPTAFVVLGAARDVAARNPEALAVYDQCFTDRNAWRGGDAWQYAHRDEV